MRITRALPDDVVLKELGERLAHARLRRDTTQRALADAAGVSRHTVLRLEEGRADSMTSLIRVMRALDLLDDLDDAIPPARPSPMELARRTDKRRRRASGLPPRQAPPAGWTWGEDQ